MSPAEVLAALAERGAALTLDGTGQVRYHGMAEVLTEDLRVALRAHLLELPEVLRRAEVFRAQVRPGYPLPVLHLPSARGLPAGCCPSCGGDLAEDSHRCGPCGEAARLVAEEASTNRPQPAPNSAIRQVGADSLQSHENPCPGAPCPKRVPFLDTAISGVLP